MEGSAWLDDSVGRLQHAGEGILRDEAAVRHGVQVGEIENGAHPVEAPGEPEDVLGSTELAYATHDLHPERDRTSLRLEPLAQRCEVLGDRFQRCLPLAPQQIAGMHDHELGADRGGNACRVVDHAERALALLLVLLEMPEDGGDGRVDGESDLVLLRELAEARRPFPFGLHPETALEIDLTRRVAALQKQLYRGLRALAAGNA